MPLSAGLDMSRLLSTALPMLAFLVFALTSLAIAAHAFAWLEQEINLNNPFHRSFAAAGWVVPGHFYPAGLALALAPLQCSSRLRRRFPRLHRTAGWLYVSSVGIAGISGLLMAPAAQGGMPTALAFGLLALFWLGTTFIALRRALQGDVVGHRRWMLRSVALTFAAVTLRLQLGIGLAFLNLPFLAVYTAAAWLCWTVNLLACELLLRAPWHAASDIRSASHPASA